MNTKNLLLSFSFLTIIPQLAEASYTHPHDEEQMRIPANFETLPVSEQNAILMRMGILEPIQPQQPQRVNRDEKEMKIPANFDTLSVSEQNAILIRLELLEPAQPQPSRASEKKEKSDQNQVEEDKKLVLQLLREDKPQRPNPSISTSEKKQVFSDYEIALRLEQELNGKSSSKSNNLSPSRTVEDDYSVFVRQFEEQERRQGSIAGIRIARQDYPNVIRLFQSRVEGLRNQIPNITTLCDAYEEYKRRVPGMDSDPQNVHRFNLEFVCHHAHRVMSIEQTLIQSKTTITFETIAQEVRRHSNDSQMQRTLAMLCDYLTVPVDGESQLNMVHLISQVYDLVQRCNERNRFQLPNGQNVSAMSYFIYSLQENLATEGGCKPGMAGRLFRDYLLLSSSILDLRKKDLSQQIEVYKRHIADFSK